MTLVRRLRLAAAVVLTAAVSPLLPSSPAAAVGCEEDTGVTVVVDFTAIGGQVATTCVAEGGGDTAASLFEVDHDLTRVQSYPGAVCRVDNAPSDLNCYAMPPEHYYWALFWSDDGEERVYSSQGVDSLRVPDGGSVAFVFHKSDPPRSETPSPDEGGSGGGGGGRPGSGDGDGDGGAGATGDSSPSAAPSPSEEPSGTATDAAGPGDRRDGRRDQGKQGREDRSEKDRDKEPTEAASPTDDPSDAVPVADAPEPGQGLPAWVAPVTIGLLFGVAGVVAVLRRRSAG